MAYPSLPWATDAAADALDGATHDGTQVPFVAKNTDETSSPTLNQQENRNLQRILNLIERCIAGSVWAEDTALNIGAFPLEYSIAGTAKSFAGATGVAVTDDDISYVYLDTAATLQVVTDATGWPADESTYIPLAEVTASGGAITSVKDVRYRGLNMVVDLGTLTQTTSATIQLDSGSNGPKLKAETTTKFSLRDSGDSAYVDLQVLNLTLAALTASGNASIAGTLDVTLTTTLAGALACHGAVGIETANGLGVDPGSDIDADLITVGVTGSPTISWDESQDCFDLTHDLNIATGKQFKINDEPLIVPVTYVINIPGTLAVDSGGSPMKVFVDKGFTFKRAKAYVNTAPTGADLICDVRYGALGSLTSFFTSQAEMLNVADGTQSDTSADKTVAVAADEFLDLEIEQVGTSVAGADITVEISGFRALQEAS